ncbi:MAG: dehydrogenase [Elusimicrobia bacterium]|nr:dehydrogenase [Elusimicrobiota bacterium]
MPKVPNWQLDRDEFYKYESSPPQKQIGYVFDTNKCIACQTCTVACKTTWTSGKGEEYMFWNNVETKPYGFYPLAWDVKALNKIGNVEWQGTAYQGKTIYEAAEDGEEIAGYVPDEEDWARPNLGEDEVTKAVDHKATFELPHSSWMFYLARICNHCSYPACLAACPRQAIYKRKEDGIVLIDQSRCRGYQKCVGACPYKKPMYNAHTGRSEKCIACYPLIEKGVAPRCVQTCIGKIRMAGFVHPPHQAEATNPIDYLVHEAKVALPLYPQFGTMPNVFYVPPIHVELPYLRQMFGPKVDAAVETYKKRDPQLVGLLSLFGSTDHLVDKFEVKDGKALGFLNNEHLVTVPVKEPVIFRMSKDENLDVVRPSIT